MKIVILLALVALASVMAIENLEDFDNDFVDDPPASPDPGASQQSGTTQNPVPYHIMAKCPPTVPAINSPFLSKTHNFLLDLFQQALRAKKTDCKRVMFMGNVHVPENQIPPPPANDLPQPPQQPRTITIHFSLPHLVHQHYLVHHPLMIHHVPPSLYNWAGYHYHTGFDGFNPTCMIQGSLPSNILSTVHINMCETHPHPHVVIHHPAGTLTAIPLMKALEYHPTAQHFLSLNPMAAQPYSHVVIFDSNLADGSGLQHIFG